jgi:hypothetical protein
MMHFSTAESVRTQAPESLSLFRKIRVLLCGVSLPRPQSDALPASLGPECRSITLAGAEGIRLGAWYNPTLPSRPLVILFHSYTNDKTEMLREGRLFRDMGCSVLLVDFRGSGASSESSTTFGYREAEDVAAAVSYAQQNLPHSALILYGRSMGAAAILRAVHGCGVRPDAIIVESVFDTMLNTIRHRFEAMGVPSFPCAELLVFWGGRQAGFNGFGHNPVHYAASVGCPILFLHGAADPRARIGEARRVFAAVPAPKRFREFPGLGHEAAVGRFPGEWREAVGRFLGEVADKPEPKHHVSRGDATTRRKTKI